MPDRPMPAMNRAAESTLRGLLHRVAGMCPDAEAIVDRDHRYTYAQLKTAVEQMAALLHGLGLRKGDRVALLMPACTSHVIALFGAIELCAIPCALHVRESDATLLAITRRLSPRVLVHDEAYADKAARLCSAVPLISAVVRSRSELTPADPTVSGEEPVIPAALAEHTLDFEPMPIAADDTAVIVLSSGTTSLPKGIVHTHRTLLASARNGARYLQTGKRACAINPFTTAFIGWYNMYLPFLYAMAKVVFLGQWDANRFLQAIQDERVTVTFLVPTLWRRLLRENLDGYDLSSVQRVGYAGEPMDPATAAAISDKICPAMINIYGTTETGSWGGCSIMLPADFGRAGCFDSVGRAARDVEIRIIAPGGAVEMSCPAK